MLRIGPAGTENGLRGLVGVGWAGGVLLGLILVACGGAVTPASQRDVPFERVNAPGSITVASYRVVPDGSAAWTVSVAMGEQRTGGYEIRIEKITLAAKLVTVSVRRTVPPPGGVVIQVITYPADAVRVKRSDLPAGDLKVVFQDTEGKRLADTEIKN